MTTRNDRQRGRGAGRAWLLVCALLLLLGLAFQGTRGLWSPDEGRFTGGAVQMLASGHWLVPRYSPDQPNLSKPPLTYWLIAASVAALGHHTWVVRLPYAMAYALTALLAGLIARTWMGDRGWLASLAYGLAIGPFLCANIVSTDGVLALCETLAMLGFVRAEWSDDAARRHRWVVWMWLGFGLAFLAKGPPGLLPLIAILAYRWRREGRGGLSGWAPLSGLALFLLVGGGWYFVVMATLPGATHAFVYREVYERIFTATQKRNAAWYGGFVVYLPFLLLGTLPWWPPLARAVADAVHSGNWAHWRSTHDPRRLLWIWLLLPLAVFFLARSRLPLYVLPLLVPVALLAALELAPRIDLARRRQQVALAAWIILLLALKGGIALYAHTHHDERALAARLRAAVGQRPFAALLFAEDIGTAYQREQRTPWGLNLYLQRPVYAVAWRIPADRARLCGTLRVRGALLVVADSAIASPVRRALQQCGTGVRVLAKDRRADLLWAAPAATN